MYKRELTVGSKGELVLPPEILKAMNLRPGDWARFTLESDRIIITKPENKNKKVVRTKSVTPKECSY